MTLVRKSLSAWLFSALLLCGQAAALAHQFEHELLEPHEHCQQCLTQSIFDGNAVAAGDTCTLIPAANAAPQAVAASRYYSHDRSTTHARSPPLIST